MCWFVLLATVHLSCFGRLHKTQYSGQLRHVQQETSATDDPSPGSISTNNGEEVEKHPLMVAEVGEQLETDYQLHELPTDDSLSTSTSSGALSSPFSSVSVSDNSTRVLVDKALLLRIELLEAENKELK